MKFLNNVKFHIKNTNATFNKCSSVYRVFKKIEPNPKYLVIDTINTSVNGILKYHYYMQYLEIHSTCL